MMFGGLFRFSMWYTGIAGLSIILAAVYTLNMVKKVFYGEFNALTSAMREIPANEKIILSVIVLAIFFAGIYPQPFLELTRDTVAVIMTRFK